MQRAARTLAIAGLLALSLLPAGVAAAHGGEEQGDLSLVLGFEVEPAYAGQPNAVELTLAHGGEPVVDVAAGELTVDVSLGDAATTLALAPAFEVGEWGTPGVYTASFIPTEPGAYTFHVTGAVDGEEVDLEMTAGPETFSEVLDPAEAPFPAADGPSGDDLTAAVGAATERADDAKARAEAATEAAAVASDEVASARTMAIAGLVTGLAGLVLGGLALATARRSRA